MSYRTQAQLAKDFDILERVTACAATQLVADPATWASSHQWHLSAEPGWDAAYAYAIASREAASSSPAPTLTAGDREASEEASRLAAQIAEASQYAAPRPAVGADETVITDGMILAAVQAIMARESA